MEKPRSFSSFNECDPEGLLCLHGIALDCPTGGVLMGKLHGVTKEVVLMSKEDIRTLSCHGEHHHDVYVVFIKDEGIESGDYFTNRRLAALHFENITSPPQEPPLKTGGKKLLEMMRFLRSYEAEQRPINTSAHRNYK